MIDLGTVRPGSTIRIPFTTFDKDDGSSITMTNYAAADLLVYKDGGTTERASTAGFTATTDFDAKTGKHLAVIDLADNTTAGFWNAGSEYLVAIDAVTVDAVTTGGWLARFRIGYAAALIDTTIATLASQTSFTLTAGPAEDDALNGHWAIIHDIASAVQLARVLILDYTGSTKTVTLVAGATFTAAAGVNISIMDMAPMQPATLGRNPVVSSAGLMDANVAAWLGTTVPGVDTAGYPKVTIKSGTGAGELSLTSGRALIQARLQKNASGGLRVPFQMTDSTNHNPATGKTVTLTRSLNGATFGGGTIGTVVEIANGWYYADFAQADVNGDCVLVDANATGCDTTPIALFMEP